MTTLASEIQSSAPVPTAAASTRTPRLRSATRMGRPKTDPSVDDWASSCGSMAATATSSPASRVWGSVRPTPARGRLGVDHPGYRAVVRGRLAAERVVGHYASLVVRPSSHQARRTVMTQGSRRKCATASGSHSRPAPGRSGGVTQPSATFSGSWRIGSAQSTYSIQSAVGVAASRWALISWYR